MRNLRIHPPHTQCDYDDIVERAYRLALEDETLIENELEKRRNNG